MYMCGTLLYLL